MLPDVLISDVLTLQKFSLCAVTVSVLHCDGVSVESFFVIVL